MKFGWKEIMKPEPLSPLKVGIVTVAAMAFYYYVWAASFASIAGQNAIVEILIVGGSAVAIALAGKKFKVF